MSVIAVCCVTASSTLRRMCCRSFTGPSGLGDGEDGTSVQDNFSLFSLSQMRPDSSSCPTALESGRKFPLVAETLRTSQADGALGEKFDSSQSEAPWRFGGNLVHASFSSLISGS